MNERQTRRKLDDNNFFFVESLFSLLLSLATNNAISITSIIIVKEKFNLFGDSQEKLEYQRQKSDRIKSENSPRWKCL